MCSRFRFFAILLSIIAASFVSAQADDPATPPVATTTPEDAKADPAAGNPPEATPKTWRLAYKFVPDQLVRYEVWQKMVMTTQYNDVTDVASNESTTTKRYRVTTVEADGSGDLELVLERVHMKASNSRAQKAVEFKSDDPENQPQQYAHILKSIGQPQAVLRCRTNGEPVKLSPVSANLPKSTRVDNDETASPEAYLAPFPSTPVAVGERWKERFDLTVHMPETAGTGPAPRKLPIKITMLRQFHLVSVENSIATIEFSTSTLTPVHDPSIEAQLIQREPAGKIIFSIDEGLVLSREVKIDRVVVNPFGAKSSLHAAVTFSEKLVRPVAAAAPAGKN